MSPFDIVILLIVFFAIVVVVSGVKTVPQGFMWTVERFGRYTRTLTPGPTSSSRSSIASAAR
jgi:regulator of protease activity HflC (stomatin/prohibitin superfamily)